jgi:hypothetical protein
MFELCQPCQDAGDRLEQALKQGVEIETVDPKSGAVNKTAYRI